MRFCLFTHPCPSNYRVRHHPLEFSPEENVSEVMPATGPSTEVSSLSKPKSQKSETGGTRPKKEKAPKAPQVLFAFCLSEAEQDLIH